MSAVSPTSLDAALAALTADTVVLAGGTDLMVEFRTGRTRAENVVDIWRVDELRGIAAEGDGLRLGALTTCAELVRDPLVRERAAILAEAADEVGAEQIKNRATLGGNLGTASPAADLNPVLVALDARVELVSTQGKRELEADAFLRGYRETARRPDELIGAVLIPPPRKRRSAFRKVGTRRAQAISKVVVAATVELEGGVVRSVRAAAGSVAPRTVRLRGLEALVGQQPSADAIAAAVRAVDVTPIDDVRSTAAYRELVLRRVLVTMLGRLCAADE
ncbi:MAG: hypothetical protein GY711_00870 [bacterium]|nr:hypothetical protein [bacterium]